MEFSTQNQVVTPMQQQIQSWVMQAPGLLRAEVRLLEKMPDGGQKHIPFKTVGLGLGAVLGVATCTQKVKGWWKVLTGGAAIGAAATGFLGSKFQDMFNQALGCTMPEMRKGMSQLADALESDPMLQQQFAAYLAATVNPQDLARGSNEVLAKKAIEFGQMTPFLAEQNIMDRATNCMGFSH